MKTKNMTTPPRTSVNPPNQPNATKVRQNMKTRSATILATIVTALVAFASASDALAQGTWTTIAPMPTGKVYASGVAFGGEFYVIDGYNTSGTWPMAPPQVYDPIANSWSFKAADPVPRAETAAGVINDKIYVAEGWIQSDSNNPTTALEIYDPATDTWTAGAPSLVARGVSASGVINGRLYITGGRGTHWNGLPGSGGESPTLEIYDAVTNTWSTGAPLPVACDFPVGAAINGKFYVVGGGANGAATANVFIYDPTTDTWTSGSPMPSPRWLAAGGVINGKLYITGGNSSYGTNNPVVVYDPITDSWSTAAAEPTARSVAAAAAVGSTLFVAGGFDNTFSASLSTAEAFTPPRCPQPKGYWKTNPALWPVTSLILGSQTYTQTELLTILKTAVGTGPKADASLILADQLIAAKLNIANGSDPTPVSGTITDADSLLSAFSGKLPYKVKTSSAIGQMMVNDGTTLGNYNNGLLTLVCTP